MKKIFILATLILNFQFLILNLSEARAAVPEIWADSAIVIETSTGRVVFEKDADTVRGPASMTKMMTCILGIEHLQPTDQVTFTAAAAATEFSGLHLAAGEILSATDLLQGMMLVSDNGGAVAIAQAVGGNEVKFAEMMNEKAKEIGCTNTNFVNPHGLTATGHYSTARDMAKIAAYCMKNATFRHYVGQNVGMVNVTQPARSFSALNTNKLLETYSGCTGIKTGYTWAAGGCLAASAKRGDIELIAIVMHSADMDTRFTDAAKLLDYGFETVDSVKEINVGDVDQVVYVRDGQSGTVHVAAKEKNFSYLMLKSEDEKLFTVSYELPRFADAEILRGNVIGEAVLNYDGKKVASIPLEASENVPQGFSFGSMLVKLSEKFKPETQDFLLKFVAQNAA